jgi:hypothetical protein
MNDAMFTADVPESTRLNLMTSPIWRATLGVYQAVKNVCAICDFFCSDTTTILGVTFCTRKDHAVVGRLTMRSSLTAAWHDPVYELESTTSHYAGVGRNIPNMQMHAESKKASYIIRAATKTTSRRSSFLSAAKGAEEYRGIDAAVRNMVATFATNNTAVPIPEMMTPDDIYPLLPVIFDGKPIVTLPPALVNKLEKYRDYHNSRQNKRQMMNETADQMFSGEKWVITYLPDRYLVGAVDTAAMADYRRAYTAWRIDDNKRRPSGLELTTTVPFRFYRKLEDMEPALYDSLMASLTMTRAYIRAQDPAVKLSEKNDLLFEKDDQYRVFPEVGAVLWSPSAVSQAYFYMVSK